MKPAELIWLDARDPEKGIEVDLSGLLEFVSREERSSTLPMSPCRKVEFVLGRCLARLMLSRVLGEPPELIQVHRDRRGRPEVFTRPDQPSCSFSLSHSDGRVGCVIATHGRVGLDIESTSRDLPCASVFETVLSPREKEQVFALTAAEDVRRRSLELWCLKEAAYKSCSSRQSRSLEGWREFVFDIDDHREVSTDLTGSWGELVDDVPDAVVALVTRPPRGCKPRVGQLTQSTLFQELQALRETQRPLVNQRMESP